ncbi:MAG TPA: chemotaxis protein CheX, partial [Thermaerobacter sp.]
MRAEYIRPFLAAAVEVLKADFGVDRVERGELRIETSYYTTQEVTAIIGLTGEIEGTAMFGTTKATARRMVEAVTGTLPPVFDEMAESAFAEFGNVVSGRASVLFEQQGWQCTISPPTVIIGRGAIISNGRIQRLIVPLETPLGEVQLAVALRPAGQPAR